MGRHHHRLRYFESLFGEGRETNNSNQYIFKCPNVTCGREKLYVYLDTNTSYCFRCGTYSSYDSEEKVSLTKKDLEVRLQYKDDFSFSNVSTPTDFSYYENLKDEDKGKYLSYLKGRGFQERDIHRYKLRFGEPGTFQRESILIPVYMDNLLVYYTIRKIGDTKIRYQNPDLSLVPNPKSRVLFNLDIARLSNTVIVMEGAFDAMTVGSSAIATFGKMLSKHQISLIERYWDNIILCLDSDAYEFNLKLYDSLTKKGKNVKILDLPNGDANSLGKKEVLKRIQSVESKKFTIVNALKYKLNKKIYGV